jgi:hypothetical protein
LRPIRAGFIGEIKSVRVVKEFAIISDIELRVLRHFYFKRKVFVLKVQRVEDTVKGERGTETNDIEFIDHSHQVDSMEFAKVGQFENKHPEPVIEKRKQEH